MLVYQDFSMRMDISLYPLDKCIAYFNILNILKPEWKIGTLQSISVLNILHVLVSIAVLYFHLLRKKNNKP